jgi:hypothetical protein
MAAPIRPARAEIIVSTRFRPSCRIVRHVAIPLSAELAIKIAPPRIGGERIKSARKLGTSSVASRHRRHHLARHKVRESPVLQAMCPEKNSYDIRAGKRPKNNDKARPGAGHPNLFGTVSKLLSLIASVPLNSCRVPGRRLAFACERGSLCLMLSSSEPVRARRPHRSVRPKLLNTAAGTRREVRTGLPHDREESRLRFHRVRAQMNCQSLAPPCYTTVVHSKRQAR